MRLHTPVSMCIANGQFKLGGMPQPPQPRSQLASNRTGCYRHGVHRRVPSSLLCPAGEVHFESSNASPESDEAFIQLLAHAAAAANSGTQGSEGASFPGIQAGGKAASKRKGARGGSSGSSAGTAKAAADRLGAGHLTKLQLAEDDVAKVRGLGRPPWPGPACCGIVALRRLWHSAASWRSMWQRCVLYAGAWHPSGRV